MRTYWRFCVLLFLSWIFYRSRKPWFLKQIFGALRSKVNLWTCRSVFPASVRSRLLNHVHVRVPMNHFPSHVITSYFIVYLCNVNFNITRWFKYDRDDLCVNKSQFVPVIFKPPCMFLLHHFLSRLYLLGFPTKIFLRWLIVLILLGSCKCDARNYVKLSVSVLTQAEVFLTIKLIFNVFFLSLYTTLFS